MGIDTWIWLGPYVEVKIKLTDCEEDRCRTPDKCPNPTSGYCSECGIAAKERFYKTQKEEPNHWRDELFEHEDVMMDNSGMSGSPEITVDGTKYRRTCYMPNVKRGEEPRRFSIDDYDTPPIIPLTSQAINKEKAWLQQAFAPEIESLKKHYGEENVTVHWGFVRWYS